MLPVSRAGPLLKTPVSKAGVKSTTPQYKKGRLHIIVLSVGVFAASIALSEGVDVQHELSATNQHLALCHQHQGLESCPEDVTYLLQASKPRVEYATEDKVKDAANISSSIKLLGIIGDNAMASAWISLAGRSTLAMGLVGGAKTVVLVVLILLCVCFVGAVFAPGLKESLRQRSESSSSQPLQETWYRRIGSGDMVQAVVPPSPSSTSSSPSVPTPQPQRNPLMTPQPLSQLAAKPIQPIHVKSKSFPSRLGVPLGQVAPFDANANHEITIVDGDGRSVMWGWVANKPSERNLQVFIDKNTFKDRRNPAVTIVSSPLGALEIIGEKNISYGFLEPERSGRYAVVHKGGQIMVVEGSETKEINIRSRFGQVAALRCNNKFSGDEPYVEFGIRPEQDAVLIVSVVLAFLLLSPGTWQPMRQM